MIKALIDTSPLANANSIRGIGAYTRHLTNRLEDSDEVTVMRSGLNSDNIFSPDITHYPFFDLFFPTLPFFKKTATVVTVHDVIPLIFPDKYKPGKKGSFNFFKQRLALQRSDAIITDSFASKEDIIKHLKISDNKIFVVQLAGNPDLNATTEKIITKYRRKLQLPKNYLLYVGDINYNKNIPQLIKMLKFLPREIKLVCVGKNFKHQEIPEWKLIENQLVLSDVKNRVKFYPEILGDATEALSAIYSGAIAYIQPSLYEGFGLPVLEAMQCNCPVVSHNNSSLSEVGGEYTVFSDDTSAEEFAKAVISITEWSEKKRNDHIASAKKWSKNFSWDKTTAKTIEVYNNVLQK